LQEEVAVYRKQEREMENAIAVISAKLNAEIQARSALEKELQEREAKVKDLEGRLFDSARELMAELSDYELEDSPKALEEEEITELPTELKLLQLSEQISYNEKHYINLNLSENSFEVAP
jgi:septal ring factor EnvC (AmiA/AmiB activator)